MKKTTIQRRFGWRFWESCVFVQFNGKPQEIPRNDI